MERTPRSRIGAAFYPRERVQHAWVIPEKAWSTPRRASRNRSKNVKPSGGAPKIDPEKVRELESLRLAKSNLQRQAEATEHPIRKQQITLAIAEIDKRLAQ